MLERDPMAIFTAAKAAEGISEYMLGLEKKLVVARAHQEWIAGYELEADRAP